MDAEEKPRPPRAPEPESRDDVVVSQNRCPFCHDDVPSDAADWVACAACLGRHHEACWNEAGRCAACRHGERLRRDPPARDGSRLASLVVVGVVLLLLGVAGSAMLIYVRVAREGAEAEAEMAEMLLAREAARAAAERAEEEAALRAANPRPDASGDARFAVALRVDELRALKRGGSRIAAREDRRRAAWKQAKVEVALALSALKRVNDAPERARLEGARDELERLDPPPRSGPVESVLDEQDDYLMPPRPEHPDHAKELARLERVTNEGYQAHLLALQGDAAAALSAANRHLLRDPTDWLGWMARGEALTILGDHAGAAMALHLAEGFSASDPTWTLLARADLERARGDRRAELAAAFEALEVGSVPEWGGHLAALLERIARLELELGE